MKYKKKTIAVILVATIGVSIFLGLASAQRQDPISQILEIVLGIDTNVDQVKTDLDNIQTDLEKTTQMLGSYSGYFVSTTSGGGTIEDARITADKPAIFTVTVSIVDYPDAYDVVYVAQAANKWTWHTIGDQSILAGEGGKTFTIAAYGICLTYYDSIDPNLEVRYCIVVQGEKDTEVKIGDWTS